MTNVLKGAGLAALIGLTGCTAPGAAGSSTPVASVPSRTTAPVAHLTRQQAVADARYLFRLLEDSHPDPYSVMGGKVSFKRKASALIASIPTGGIAVDTFAAHLQRFLVLLQDAHTFIRAPAFEWKDPADAVPVRFGVTASGLFVASFDAGELDGTRGMLLTGALGRSIDELIAALSSVVPTENLYDGYAKLAHVITSPRLLGALFPDFEPGKGISLQLRHPGGAIVERTLRIGGARSDDPSAWRSPPVRWSAVPRTDEPFHFKLFEKESVAYFRVANIIGREAFELAYRNHWGQPLDMLRRYFQKRRAPMPENVVEALGRIPSFLEQTEKLLGAMAQKNLQHLFVDLRGNGGGMTPMVYPFLYQMYGDAYYGHRFPGEMITVQSELYLKKMNKTVDGWRAAKGNPGFALGDYDFHTEAPLEAPAVVRNAQLAKYRSAGMSFAGKLDALNGQPIYRPPSVVVICDAYTFSAAFHFLFYLRDLGAKVVGVPSGQSPNTFMEVTPFKLPESSLEGSISNSAQLYLPEKPLAKVLEPDFALHHEDARSFDFDEHAAVRMAFRLLAEGRIGGSSNAAAP